MNQQKENPTLIYILLLVAVVVSIYFILFLLIKAGEMENTALEQCIDSGNSVEYCKSLLY